MGIADLSKVIEFEPNNSLAYNDRGSSIRNVGQFDAAIADLDKAIELKPDYAWAYYNRGLVCEEQEQWDAAIANFSKATELEPALAIFDQALAEAYISRGS